MNQEQLLGILETLTGHLHTASPAEEQSLNNVQEMLARSLAEQPSPVSNQHFSFEGTDLLLRQNIERGRLDNLERVVSQTLKNKEESDLRVFVRDVPIRTTQVTGSVPDWAAGSRPVHTDGPFINRDGRRIWFDFYRVEKLVALYIQGQSNPVILFKSEFQQRLIDRLTHKKVELVKSYKVMPGSVWINAHALTTDAPNNRYAGVKVKGGTINLDAVPVYQGDNLTVTPVNNIEIALQLEQDTDDDAANTSSYGKDARNAKYHLPDTWNFSLNGSGKNITAIANATATMYGQTANFKWAGNQAVTYNAALSRILIPWNADITDFNISQCESPFGKFSGKAPVINSWWALPAAVINIAAPLEASGNGAVLISCGKGIETVWHGLKDKNTILVQPFLLGEPGRIGITDLISNGLGASQHLELWKGAQNPHGNSVDLLFLPSAAFIFNTVSKGDELLITLCNATMNIDRPVKVNGEPFEVRSKNSVLALAANDTLRLIYLYDDNIIWDNKLPGEKIPAQKLYSIALQNALFTVSPVNGALLFGTCDAGWKKITIANLFLTFGMYSYLPTLPDPYLANLNVLLRQFRYDRDPATGGIGKRNPWLWLICNIQYKPLDETNDAVKVGFHFGLMPATQNLNPQPDQPLTLSNTRVTASERVSDIFLAEPVASVSNNITGAIRTMMAVNNQLPNYQEQWDGKFGSLDYDAFALMDVSSNANQLGVSFGYTRGDRGALLQTGAVITTGENTGAVNSFAFPFIVDGMDVKAQGQSVRVFMEPQVAWEPIFNLSAPDGVDPLVPNSPKLPMDPEVGFKYFANDGGPTKIFNNSNQAVTIAPIPLVDYLLDYFKNNSKSILASKLTLPFGLRALAYITKHGELLVGSTPIPPRQTAPPEIESTQPEFRTDLKGGIQITVYSGDFSKAVTDPHDADSPMLPGFTMQMNNLLEANGTAKGCSNLGQRVTEIFNNEFFTTPILSNDLNVSRGVPVTRLDFTGYGFNMLTNWLSPSAAMAQTSQARFDVMLGRTSHEVIQVKSIIYPWGIRVVRTITLFRVSTGYIYRYDSGWKAQSDGKFDFSYSYKDIGNNNVTKGTPYEFHPGIISGLFDVRNIKDAPSVAEYNSSNSIANGQVYLNGVIGQEMPNSTGSTLNEPVKCGAVYFDADIEIENVKQGHKNGRVVSKKVLGYVQLAPAGKPLSTQQFKSLLELQGGTIGAEVDCVIDINKNNQQMRLSRVDVSPSVDAANNTIFVVAARGSVTLPKDGSWSMVQHETGTGEVTPVPENFPVPLIREGKWMKNKVINPADVTDHLIRIANPKEILRSVAADTINFGYLQNTTTQKALFLTPSYGLFTEGPGLTPKLFSKTPPIFADAYRMMTGNGIFPNIGDAVTNFGKAMPMLNADGVQAFAENALKDGGKKVLELMEIQAQKAGEEVIQQGLSLLKKGVGDVLDKALKFDVPDFNVYLVDMDALKIYIEYKAAPKGQASSPGKLNFDVESFANDMADQWKSRLNNLAMVVDLGSMERIMTIKGNFNSKKGTETGYEGDSSADGGIPTPEIEFSDALKPVIAILEMLAALSTGDYASALKKGLKVAMSNAGEIWEYKFEATKEIGLIRFPPTEQLYNSPQTPLKLEASMSLGVYFDAALKVTTDPKQLLPTAGAFLQFHGGLQVMCFSLGVGSIFAIGSVDVTIAADTKVGPSLGLKFGFGAQIVVGFPVIANVSVTFMVGVEMHADLSTISLAAILYFRGHADILGGIVSITITIEAKGIIVRKIAENRTDCSAQVTFALDISIAFIINISFSKTWGEDRQVAAADNKYGS